MTRSTYLGTELLKALAVSTTSLINGTFNVMLSVGISSRVIDGLLVILLEE